MKTLKRQLEDKFNMNNYPPMDNTPEADRILQLEQIVLKLAQSIDVINQYAKFQ